MTSPTAIHRRSRRLVGWPSLSSALAPGVVAQPPRRTRRARAPSAAASTCGAPRRRRAAAGRRRSRHAGGARRARSLRSVVYLESAPRGAFEADEGGHAVMDQRNETFVPHVLAITTGTTVDFPNSDQHLPQRVFALEDAAVRSRPLRRRPFASRSASIGPASCACSATSTRT